MVIYQEPDGHHNLLGIHVRQPLVVGGSPLKVLYVTSISCRVRITSTRAYCDQQETSLSFLLRGVFCQSVNQFFNHLRFSSKGGCNPISIAPCAFSGPFTTPFDSLMGCPPKAVDGRAGCACALKKPKWITGGAI